MAGRNKPPIPLVKPPQQGDPGRKEDLEDNRLFTPVPNPQNGLRRGPKGPAYLSKGILEVQSLRQITQDEIDDLFLALDADGNGWITMEELRAVSARFIHADVASQLEEVGHRAAAAGGQIPRDAFEAAVRGEALGSQRDMLVQIRGLGSSDGVLADWLEDWLQMEEYRKDALIALPTTLTLFFLFWQLVRYHFQIFEAQQVTQSLHSGLKTPAVATLHGWGGNVEEFWNYTWSELVPAAQRGTVARHNYVLGGVRLTQDRSPFTPDAFSKRAGLVSNQGWDFEQKDALWLTADNAQESVCANAIFSAPPARCTDFNSTALSWIDGETTAVHVDVATYNAELSFFSSAKYEFDFDRPGSITLESSIMTITARPEGVSADLVRVLDYIFIIVSLYGNAYEFLSKRYMIADWRKGIIGFTMLFNVWMTIEVLSFGAVLVIVWNFQRLADALAQLSLTAEELPEPKYAGGVLDETVAKAYDGLHDDLATTLEIWYTMRMGAALNAVCILLRFFKTFRASPKLSVVTRTLQVCAYDVIYFGVVLYIVVNCFVISGHILFGNDIGKFGSLYFAMNYTFDALIQGIDFWEIYSVDVNSAILWYWCFNLLVKIIMMSMIISIMMEAYVVVKKKARAADHANVPLLWKPPREFGFLEYPPRGLRYSLDVLPKLVTWTGLAQSFDLTEAQARRLVSDAQAHMLSVVEADTGRHTQLSDLLRQVGLLEQQVGQVSKWMKELRSGGANKPDDRGGGSGRSSRGASREPIMVGSFAP